MTEAPQPRGRHANPQLHSSGVNWAEERERLLQDGDTEGVEDLDCLLASPRRGQIAQGVIPGMGGAPDRSVTFKPLTDADILDGLASRRGLRQLRAELRPGLEHPATTPVEVCARWRLLAPWALRFSRSRQGREVLHFGVADGGIGPVCVEAMFPPKGDERRAPELEWAEAFHSTTAALIPLVLDARMEDATLQRLLRDMEALLNGHQVTLTDVLHEVEVTVRTLEGRYSHRSAVTRLHEVVRQIAGRISNIRTLLDRYVEPAIGLAVLDHYVKAPDTDPEPGAPERSAAWRPIIEELRSLLSDARQLWGADTAPFDAKPANMLTRASAGTTKCGPIERNTAHEVVIAVGRLILDPSDSGALRQNELGRVAGVVDMPAQTTRDVARLRVVRELASRQWWSDVELGLEREYAQAFPSPPREHTPTSEASAPEGSSSHPELQDQRSAPGATAVDHHADIRPMVVRVTASPPQGEQRTREPNQTVEPNPVNMLIRDGRTWRIRFNGVERPLRDLKGLQYLQKLVANPGKPTHVADLQGRGPVQITTKDPIVDRKTKAALRVQFEDATSQLDLALEPA